MPELAQETAELRLPPQDLDVEKAVLGALFLDKEAVALAVEHIDETYFYKTAHRLIFRAISELFEKDSEVDMLTIMDTLKRMDSIEA